ncbi:MAG: hypothetical protein HWD63_11955 [Candidatus Parvibacillus calidus]|nr:MAG: hypothetical protein HWD63_11955 [Candidatus Parvibacillus calidus]
MAWEILSFNKSNNPVVCEILDSGKNKFDEHNNFSNPEKSTTLNKTGIESRLGCGLLYNQNNANQAPKERYKT